jgi:hypothetical protein
MLMESMQLHWRHVSAQAHAVKICRSQSCRGGGGGAFAPHSIILRLSSRGSGASEPFFLCVCLCIPVHSEGNPHGKIVHYPFSILREFC